MWVRRHLSGTRHEHSYGKRKKRALKQWTRCKKLVKLFHTRNVVKMRSGAPEKTRISPKRNDPEEDRPYHRAVPL